MRYVLVVNYEKCTGCHLCELACSLKHHGVFNPYLSRITVITRPESQASIPIYCLQCREALCARSCPANAIVFDTKLGAWVIDYDRCIGCRECAYACPLSAIGFDVEGQPIKCDLCGGEPECVKVCPNDALIYGPEDKVLRLLRTSRIPGLLYRLYLGLMQYQRGDEVEKAEDAVRFLFKIFGKSK